MMDGHMHLEYGPLSKEYVLEFIEYAKQNNIDEIQILDHTHRFIEFKDMYQDLRAIEVQDVWLNSKKKFCNTLDEFITLMEEIKQMDTGVTVTYGLEVCYVPEQEEFIRDVLENYHFDFLVGAIHSIDGILYDMGFSKQLLWDVQDVNAIYKRYYELIFLLIKSDLFTQLAHPDTIKMFSYYPTYDITPTYHELAELLVAHKMKAENNTGCHYRYKHKDIGLSDALLTILKSHNVDMITASDAHQPDHVGSFIKEIYEKTMDS